METLLDAVTLLVVLGLPLLNLLALVSLLRGGRVFRWIERPLERR